MNTSQRYTVVCQGYEPMAISLSLQAAQDYARAQAGAILKKARRNHKQARKHKLSEGAYRITLGPDKNSTVYSHISVIPC